LLGYLPKILKLHKIATNHIHIVQEYNLPTRVHNCYLECSFLYFSMKREGCVVINTGNFLHSFAVDLEKLRYGTLFSVTNFI
jgi:hypothetical protein